MTRGLVDRNVAHDMHTRLPRTSAWDGKGVSAAELAQFLENARTHRLYPALHLAAHTGMRRGELVGLKWIDFDATGQRVSICRTIQCLGGRPVEFGVKTRTSRRCVDLDDSTVDCRSDGAAG